MLKLETGSRQTKEALVESAELAIHGWKKIDIDKHTSLSSKGHIIRPAEFYLFSFIRRVISASPSI